MKENEIRRRNKRIINLLIIVVFIVIVVFFILTKTIPNKYDGLALCLSEKGVFLYGTSWCSNCQEQKRLFGSSFKYISYIDCDENKKACDSQNITAYPTWILSNGEKLLGVQSPEKLKIIVGC